MVACQLLLEITAFLRESHSSLARKAENQRLRNKSIAFSRQNRRTTQKVSVFGAEHRDAVTSGPAERLRQGNPSMLSPVMNLLVPTVQIQQGGSEKKMSAPVIKVDGGPSENDNDEASKPPRKRFSALFSNSEKKRKLLKPETTERKASSTSSRIYKKSTKCKYRYSQIPQISFQYLPLLRCHFDTGNSKHDFAALQGINYAIYFDDNFYVCH